jgi:branched-chain amino acid transport system substrate-binding protein
MVSAAGCRLPGSVRPTVKIGLVAPFEGRYRYVGYDVIYAVRLALNEANAAGGVGGYGIELVAYDDGADPDQAAEQARKLDVDPDVVAAIGHFREDTTEAAFPKYLSGGLPLLAPGALDPTVTERDGPAYRLGPPAELLAEALLESLSAAGSERPALATTGGPLGAALLEAASVSPLEPVTVVSPGVDGWLEQTLAADVDTLLCDAPPVTSGEMARALREAGWQGTIVGGPELAATDFEAIAGAAAKRTTYVTPWPRPADIPSSEPFAAAYRQLSGGTPPGPLALAAYEATWVLIEALERDLAAHGTPSRAGLAGALAETDRIGLLGRIRFSPDRSWHEAPLYTYICEE